MLSDFVQLISDKTMYEQSGGDHSCAVEGGATREREKNDRVRVSDGQVIPLGCDREKDERRSFDNKRKKLPESNKHTCDPSYIAVLPID